MLKLEQLDYVSSHSREACEKRHVHKLVTVPFSIFTCFVFECIRTSVIGFCSFPESLTVAIPLVLFTVTLASRNIA